MNTKQYIDSVLSHIKNKAYKKDIENEITSHIEERQEYYIQTGYDENQALNNAVKQMGDPDKLGEEMNRLYKNTPALIFSFALLFVFALCLIYYFIGFNFIDFAVISTDSEVITVKSLIVSFLAFASGALCFKTVYKNRFSDIALILGIIYLVSVFAFFIFLPTGNSIFGFFFDFPAVFTEKDFYFFKNEISWGNDKFISNYTLHTIFAYTEIALIGLFFVSGFINAVFSFKMAVDMKKNTFTENETKYKRFSTILVALTVVCLFTMTAEITADYVKEQNRDIYFAQSQHSDFNKAKNAFEKINVPIKKEDAQKLSDEYKNENDIIPNYGNDVILIAKNPHYQVFVYDDDSNGIFETKRIYSDFEGGIGVTKNQLSEITEDMTSVEFIKKIGLKNVSEYSYTANDGDTTEIIILYISDNNNISADEKQTFYTYYFKNGEQLRCVKEEI